MAGGRASYVCAWLGHATPLLSQVREIVASRTGARLEQFADVDRAAARLEQICSGLVIVHMPDIREEESICDLIRHLKSRGNGIHTVILTDVDDPGLHVRMLREGAAECLSRPIDLARLTFIVEILAVHAHCRCLKASDRPCCEEEAEFADGAVVRAAGGFIAASEAARDLLEEVRVIAPLDTTVLLTGETGTGKTHLARTIHELSPRKSSPFVVVQCGAIPAALFEGELFGHLRGAYTGADRDCAGRLAEAKGGTLLLDDIDCVPLDSQSKLLRVVEDHLFEPVGSSRSERLDARLIAASNRSLEEEVSRGAFRADLYHRLNVLDFALPPLREQRDAVRPLAEHFLRELSGSQDGESCTLSEATLDALRLYDWPGNVRELRNAVERAFALSRGCVIDVGALPDRVRRARPDSERRIDHVDDRRSSRRSAPADDGDREALVEALDHAENNRSRAASALGISRVTLYKKLRRYGLL